MDKGMNGKNCAVGALCPVSFGFALGITCALAVLFWAVWVMFFGMPSMMASKMMLDMTWAGVVKHAILCFVKGFLFGFVLAFVYDMILCCGSRYCCRKDRR